MSKFSIILTSSVHGELDRRIAASRPEAFQVAGAMLRERAAGEASHSVAALHGETISIRIESDDG